jgi:hypothetical protein
MKRKECGMFEDFCQPMNHGLEQFTFLFEETLFEEIN